MNLFMRDYTVSLGLTQEPLPTRVAEMVAESITRESLRHRIKQIGENYNPKSLRYWDLINLGDASFPCNQNKSTGNENYSIRP